MPGKTPGKIFSTLICQNQTSLHRKLNAAYVCRTARSAASTQVKVGANWKDFGKLLVNVLRNITPAVSFTINNKPVSATRVIIRRVLPLA